MGFKAVNPRTLLASQNTCSKGTFRASPCPAALIFFPQVMVLLVQDARRSCLRRDSGVLFCFWTLSLLFGILPFQSLVRRALQVGFHRKLCASTWSCSAPKQASSYSSLDKHSVVSLGSQLP